MTDRNRAEPRFNKADPGKVERDAATKAVLDNMAKLKALRLAREAAEPPRPAPLKKTPAKSKPPDDKSKKRPPAAAEEDDYEDGDIATPKRDRYGDDDQPL